MDNKTPDQMLTESDKGNIYSVWELREALREAIKQRDGAMAALEIADWIISKIDFDDVPKRFRDLKDAYDEAMTSPAKLREG